MRQFDTHLPPDQVPNAGNGPRLDYVEGRNRIALLRATRVFAESLDLEVSGVRMQLRHAPGETEDQRFVWLPDSRGLPGALATGDAKLEGSPVVLIGTLRLFRE